MYSILNSERMNNNLSKFLPMGQHSNFKLVGRRKNIHFTEGCGTRLYDVDHNEYLDFNCKYGANILGHKHNEYIEKMKECLYEVNAVDLSRQDYDTCKIISDNVKSAEQIRFSLSGTEAVENAIRLARGYTRKQWILRFVHNYHGNADNIMGGVVTDFENPFPDDLEDSYYTLGRADNVLKDQTILIPWNEKDIFYKTINKFGHNIAAVLTEPISINGGGILPKNGYLQYIRDLCTEYNIMLIFDEIITGFRVDVGGAQKIYNVIPDITVLGKAMAGGMFPMSAIVGKKGVMRMYAENQVIHGGTFNGYRVGLKAVHTTIDILSRNGCDIFFRMKDNCKIIRGLISQLAEEYEIKLQINGYDTCFVTKYFDENISKMKNMHLNSLLEKLFLEKGIYLCNGNRWYGNISINMDDIELLKKMIRSTFEEFRSVLINC